MKYYSLILSCLIFLITQILIAQETTLPVPTDIQKTYNNKTRDSKGIPGENYWQNSSDYDIDIEFDPQTRKLTGQETIKYTNNSPDTLNTILFKLYPNIYKKGAPRDESIDPSDLTNGVDIKKITRDGQEINPDSIAINATNMNVYISDLKPGTESEFKVDWAYTLNKKSHIRTGEVDETSHFIAYFFPRITVYDDIDGWNLFNYTGGTQEFYNDFSDFSLNITVPKDYVVWATGTLQNKEEVLNQKQVSRIKKAEEQDDVIEIIGKNDLGNGKITTNKTKNTWNFKAENITDVAFATSNHYVWKSTSVEVDPETKRRTRVDAVYNPKHEDYDEVIDFARQTVKEMSFNLPAWSFPYPHETVFDGLDKMEYPMMANDINVEDRENAITLTVHEIFHTMLPFYMGTNETKHSFMDEGWATLAEWLISKEIDSSAVDLFGVDEYNQLAGSQEDLPIMTKSTYQPGIVLPDEIQSEGMAYFLNSYPKPAFGYLYVKDMLGDELFTKALHHYIENWNGKHPMPWDFFNSMNEGAGKNLNWFWKKWFFGDGYPDLAIKDVQKNGNSYKTTVESIGNKPTPINLTYTFSDGSTKKLHKSIEAWKDGNSTVSLDLNSSKKLKKVELGDTYDADIDKSDNVFEMD